MIALFSYHNYDLPETQPVVDHHLLTSWWQLTLGSLLDAMIVKAGYAIFINFIVLFLIFTIMNTIPSVGLPGREALDDTTAFAVCIQALLNTCTRACTLKGSALAAACSCTTQ